MSSTELPESTERLFLAIPIPGVVREQLAEVGKRLRIRGLRRSRADQMHLTLRFLGDTRLSERRCILEAMQSWSVAPFTLHVGDLGVFPESGDARVVWVGIAPHPLLFELQSRVEAGVRGCGWPPEQRPWSAHITLGRLRRPAALPARALDEARGGIECLDFLVDRIFLYRSRLQHNGAVYTVEHETLMRQ